MKHYLIILFNLFFCVSNIYSQEFNYSSSQQIRNYLASNLTKLDAIEGEYDVEFSGEFITPFVHQYLDRENFKIWIVRENGNFKIYTNDGGGFRKSRYLKIQPIGETNVYTFYYDTTPTRIYLENLNHFRASLHLNNSSANTYRGASFTAASVNILPVYDCIKVYPTMSMYSDVIRKHVEEEVKPSLWTGTGFALKDNYIVTNYHVVEDAKSISVRGVNGNFTNNYSARVVASDKFNDLAILKVKGVNIPTTSIPYSIKTATSEVGEDVFVLGYPLTSTMGDEIKLTTGVVSSKSGFQGDVSLYQISAPIQPGNSGGPLFDGKGNIIGIVSAKHKGTENVSYAIKTSYLKNLMESSIPTNILPQTNKIQNQNLSGKVKSVKDYVYYIVCSSQDNAFDNSTAGYANNSANISNNNGTKTINNPSISNRFDKSLTLISVAVKPDETVLTISCKNDLVDGWMNIDKNAYIMANGTKYMLTGTEGIAYSPNYTYFSYQGESKTFKLHFQAIPQNTSSIDFIESPSSEWRLYGIKLQ